MSEITYQQQTIPVADTQISTHVRLLENTSRTLHFLHGNGFAVRSYDVLLKAMAGNENIMLQDAAGHGLSPAGEAFVGWEASSERFHEVLVGQKNVHQWTEVIGAGHSFGGCMTLLMGARNPQLFQQMVLLDPAFYPPQAIAQLNDPTKQEANRQSSLIRQTERRRTRWDNAQAVQDSLRERGTFVGWQAQCLADYVTFSTHAASDGSRQLNCPPWLEAALFGSSPSTLWSALEQVRTPTYVIWGQDTLAMFQESYRLARALNPALRFIEVAGGHCFMMQQPDQTARLVRAVIDHDMTTLAALQASGFVVNYDD